MKVFADGLLNGKVALITGGGTGIGKATALEMARLGAKIAICSRKQEHLDSGSAALKEAGADFIALPCNIRNPEEVTKTVDAVLARFGRIDILLNNAGGQFPSPAAVLQHKGWNAVIDTNLNGTWYMTQAVATKSMIKTGGVIVNVVITTERGTPGVAHSGAARAAVVNLTRSLAAEWAQFGIRVLSIAPGTIETEGLAQYPPALMEQVKKRIPWGRTGNAEEIAWAITYLASPAADFCTGELFTIDGGARLYNDVMPIRKIKKE
ncbi:MAG: SDR family oxidoreductase [Bdellovibrionota bacterium]